MRISTKLVAILGSLVGLSAAVLPSSSFASTSVVSHTNAVTLDVNNVLALALVSGVAGDNDVTYSNGTYSATLDAGSTKSSFGTSTFRVTCNYIGSGSNSCSTYGWKVNAASNNKAQIGGVDYATMEPTNPSTNPAKIYTKSGTLSSSESNWQMRVAGSAKSVTINGNSYSTTPPTYAPGYNVLNLVPPGSIDDGEVVGGATVVSGNTFQTINSVANTYIGDQEFTVTYGVSTGGATPADTYTGTITYTLSLNAAS